MLTLRETHSRIVVDVQGLHSRSQQSWGETWLGSTVGIAGEGSAAMTPEGREMRFDLCEVKKILRYSMLPETVVTAMAEQLLNLHEAALLAPSPCGVEGHRMCDWVHFTDCAHPTYTDTQIGDRIMRTCNTCAARIDDIHVTGRTTNPMHPGTPGFGVHDYCCRCAELERVRKLERAAALEEAAKHSPRYVWEGPHIYILCQAEGCTWDSRNAHILGWSSHIESLIPVEDQSASYPPPRIDGDVLTYAGFKWKRFRPWKGIR